MTITTTLRKFNQLKEVILKDGKIESAEVDVLLDFISPYARAENKPFSELYRKLSKVKESGKVSEEDSKMLIDKINKVSLFLAKEKMIESFISGFAGILFLFVLIYMMCH